MTRERASSLLTAAYARRRVFASLRPLLFLLLPSSVVLSGCESFGSEYRYNGRQLIARGAYFVSAVFHTAEAPVVMAVRRVEGDAEMNLLSLADERTCVAGRFSAYRAAVDQRGFRLSLLDQDGETWNFLDQNCHSSLRIDDVAVNGLTLVLDIPRNQHQYLLSDRDAVLWALDPFEGTRRKLIGNLSMDDSLAPAVVASSLPLPAAQLGVWVSRSDGLNLVSVADGTVLHRLPREVLGFGVDGPYVGAGGAFEVLLLSEAEGPALLLVSVANGQVSSSVLWVQQGACRPRFHRELAGCLDSVCSRQVNQGAPGPEFLSQLRGLEDDLGLKFSPDRKFVQTLSHSLPWLGMEAPCGSGDLLLRPLMGAGDVNFKGAYADYGLVTSPDEENIAVVYRTALDGGQTTHFVTLDGDASALELPLNLGMGVEPLEKAGTYRVLTAEPQPRWGVWDVQGGFTPFLDDIAVNLLGGPFVQGDLVLHDAQEGGATLSRCVGPDCEPIARGVYPIGYRAYTTQPRIGAQVEAVAFLRDYDMERRSGELVVSSPELGVTKVIDQDVDSYREVETGPARGIVYSVRDEARRGLWFAPR